MRFRLRLLLSRWRRAGGLTALRVVGLGLAALLAATVPTFVAASMERVLQRELSAGDPPAVVVAWTAPDDGDYADALGRMDQYLSRDVAGGSGLEGAQTVTLPSTGPRGVQVLDGNGQVQPGRKYYKLASLPDGLELASGRMPEPGKAEVVLPEVLLTKSGYQLGNRLKVPLTTSTTGETVTVTVVGTVRTPTGALAPLWGSMESALLTSPAYWETLEAPVGEMTWAVFLPPEQVHTTAVPALVAELNRLPLRAAQLLAGAEVIETPVAQLSAFVAQMVTTQRFLLVLLTPVFLLVVFFVGATAGAVVESRRVEIAVLRSRGATPLQVVAFYLPESLGFVGLATLLAIILTLPSVRLMGYAAGFLQLVGRAPLPAALTLQSLLYALAAAMLAELVSLALLARATGFTVVTIKQEAVAFNAVLTTLRVVAELGLFAVVGYGTWRVLAGGGLPDDALMWALPPLSLAAAAVLFLRLFGLVLRVLDRVFRRWLSPALYLAVTILRRPPARLQTLALMLVITAGLGLYGAAFARTLDRDLVARTEYRLGADVVIKPYWENEVLEYGSDGLPTLTVYREPPYSEMQDLPGVAAMARVQARTGISLAAGTRNLGKTDIVGLSPQEFAGVGQFIADLTPNPEAFLNGLALDEQSVLVSSPLAQRLNLKAGDRLTAKQEGNEAVLVVVGIVPYWPGRLPETGEFLVGNLPYLQDMLGLAPYEVWTRLEPGASVQTVLTELQSRGVRLTAIADSSSQVASGRREPFRLGIYATLSTGFVVAMVAMILTYLLSAGLTLQSRAKELGVLRAMGMPAKQVSLSLYTEQLTVVAAAAAAGLGAGSLAASIYVPVFRQQPGEQLLPVRVAGLSGDRLTLVLILVALLAIGATVIAAQMRRLNVGAVLRLGEDA